MSSVTLTIQNQLLTSQAEHICARFGFTLTKQQHSEGFQLLLADNGLQLCWHDEPKLKPLMVDFVAGANAHRRQFGGGRGQSIAKAVGLKSGANPSVVDGTAGLGKDAFVLASLGCSVLLVERHPVGRALLDDGLKRAYEDDDIGPWMKERMTLSPCGQIGELLNDGSGIKADVVYLDPMYPHQQKTGKQSALVKKDMRLFQSLVGSDMDADQLLTPALEIAQKRVVVKRPDYAEYLQQKKPSFQLSMKKNRFDVYVC